MTPARWTNGKREIAGCWEYYRPGDRFTILLDSRDRITGQQRRVVTHNDTPEWGTWKLVREDTP